MLLYYLSPDSGVCETGEAGNGAFKLKVDV